MRLSDYAKLNGITYRTAKRWFDAGKIEGAYRMSEKIIIVPDPIMDTKDGKTVAIYARVSSHDQKQDLERQAERLTEYAIANGYIVSKVVKETASGMNPRRKKLTKLLQDKFISKIIVENRDVLARMNAELIMAASPKEIVIVNQIEPEENDIQDVVDFLTSIYARQYGKRSAKTRAKEKAKQIME